MRITPLQPVSAAGQTVRVGAAPLEWNLSGPGQLDLFGRHIRTQQHFDGPIRPRLELTHINEDAEGCATEPGRQPLPPDWCCSPPAAWTGLRRMPPGRTALLLAGGVALVAAINAVGFYLLASDTPEALREVRSRSVATRADSR